MAPSKSHVEKQVVKGMLPREGAFSRVRWGKRGSPEIAHLPLLGIITRPEPPKINTVMVVLLSPAADKTHQGHSDILFKPTIYTPPAPTRELPLPSASWPDFLACRAPHRMRLTHRTGPHSRHPDHRSTR